MAFKGPFQIRLFYNDSMLLRGSSETKDKIDHQHIGFMESLLAEGSGKQSGKGGAKKHARH